MKIDFVDDKTYSYVTIQNVFESKEFDLIKNYAKEFKPGDHFLNCKNEHFDLLQEKAWKIHSEIFDTLLSKTDRPLNPYIKDKQRSSFFRIQLKRLRPGFTRNRIHRDSDWKQFVVVIYLSDQGTGTKLYKENNPSSHYKTIPFEPNSAYAHIPCSQSWHDFDHSIKFDKDRLSIMFILTDTRWYV
jgi:hypothetical protein